jgi:hypothetical protein
MHPGLLHWYSFLPRHGGQSSLTYPFQHGLATYQGCRSLVRDYTVNRWASGGRLGCCWTGYFRQFAHTAYFSR